MKKIAFLTRIMILGLTLSCNDEVLNKVNPNGVTLDTYFNNDAEITAGVNAVYALVQHNGLVSREWFFTHDLRSDEVATGGGQLEAPRAQLLNGVNDAGNSVSNAVFTGWFRVIHRANVVIEAGAAAKPTISEAVRTRVVGEAKFLRAWAYYELGTLWGGVPIYTEYAKSVEGSKARSSQQDVYNLVISDLKAAL